MRPALSRAWGATARYRIPIGIALLLIFVAIFVWRQHDEIAASISAARHADPYWIAVALGVQTLAIGMLSMSYVAVMRLLGYRLTWRRLTRLHLRRMVIATATPAGSATSIYVFVNSVENDGVPASDALLTIALRGACGYAAFVLLLPAAIVMREQTLPVQLAALALAVLLVFIVLTLRAVLGGERMPDWFERRMPRRVVAFIDDARQHEIHLHGLALPALYSLASKLASVGVVYASLLAVDVEPTFSVALVGYVVANISQAFSPVFGGLGIVELTTALALQQVGVPGPEAIAAALIFRLCDLWYQLALGLLVQVNWSAGVRRLVARLGWSHPIQDVPASDATPVVPFAGYHPHSATDHEQAVQIDRWGGSVTVAENKELARRFFEEVWNQKRETAIDEFIAPGAAGNDPDFGAGRAGFREQWRKWHAAFPDLHFAIEDLVAEDDKVLARWTLTGTHRGEFMGVPASGRRIEVSGMSLDIIKDGQIASGFDGWDALGLRRQLGLVE